MATGIEVNPNIMRWAIQASNRNIQELQQKFSEIYLWTNEVSHLTVSELNKLSKELKIPFGYFFLSNPPVEEVDLLKYRTIHNEQAENPSRELVDTIKAMERKQRFMRDSLIEDGFLPLPFVGSTTLAESPDVLASQIKAEIGLSEDWNVGKNDAFNYLREKLSTLGIMVMQSGIVANYTKRSLDVNEFRAFVMIDEYAPLIFINATDSPRAKLFSLCHEIVHIWLGMDELYNESFALNQVINNEDVERFCNEVAAEILLPKQALLKSYDSQKEVETNVEEFAKKYSISELVVCIRLKNLTIIDQKTFASIYANLLKKIHEKFLRQVGGEKSGGNFYNTLGSRLDTHFVHSVNRKAREGKILYTEAYELIGAKGKTYDKLIHYMESR